MAPDAPVPSPIAILVAALLRTAGWLYGAIWVVVAAASPWGPPGLVPVVLLLPLAPLVLLATLRSLRRRPPAPPAADSEPARRAHAFLSAPLTPQDGSGGSHPR